MALAGGPADKLGNRYELWWTVLAMMDILQGEWDAIRLEQPGIEKAEFVLRRGSVESFHQAKRQTSEGKWTLSELASKDNPYLQVVASQLQAPSARIVFVSGSDAPELAELSSRARDSVSLDEFLEFFVQSKKHHASFALVQKIWGDCDAATARDYLKRIEVRVLDEKSLRHQALMTAQALFLLSPSDVCKSLCSLVLDSVHRYLSRAEILSSLAKDGHNLRQVAHAQQARPLIDAVTQAYLNHGRGRLIRGQFVPRDVTGQLHAHMNGPKIDCAVTGRAGTGKSGCVAEFVQGLVDQGIPVLAFRLDRVDPVKTTKDLGVALGFDESPALFLGAAAEGHAKAALVIDQLDSISTTSGRTTGFFDAVEGMLKEAHGLRAKTAIHVFVACREFDWKNDHRLRQLLNKEHAHIPVGDFGVEQVKVILEEAGIVPGALASHQLTLLCLPQNLSLFLEADSTADTPFHTTLDLFDRYWTSKRAAVADRSAPAVDEWNEIISAMVDGMTTSQQLSVRREALDKCSPRYVDQMISESVITREGHRIGFGHESFFDYCFARQFVQESRPLTDFLLQDEQHLFRRAQVRQVLQYLHEGEPDRFCDELRGLNTHPQIRMHIKDLALAVSASGMTISDQEWALWLELIESHLEAVRVGREAGAVSKLAWKHFYPSIALFQRAFETGLVQRWLESENDAIADMALAYLRAHETAFSFETATLLSRFAGLSEAWNKRLVLFMQVTDLKASREIFELFLQLLRDGTLDEARGPIAVNSTFWSLAYDLSEKAPARVCEIVASWMARQLERIKAEDNGEALISFPYDNGAEHPLEEAAKREPQTFVMFVLPVILSIADWAKHDEIELPQKDRVWRYLPASDEGQSTHHLVLRHLQRALQSVAATNPDRLSGYVEILRSSNLYIANVLLFALFSGNGAYFANMAADLLTQEPWRFESGVSGNSHWYAQQVVGGSFEHADADRQRQLESTVLRYVSPWEKTAHGYKYYGCARFNLLAMIPVRLRSAEGSKSFQEFERKFGRPAGKPEGPRAGWVGSPIPDNGLAKMDDDAILASIEHYSKNTRQRKSYDFLRGGASELARAIAALAEKEPTRFASIALRIPSDTASVFLSGLLRVFEKHSPGDKAKLALCSKAFGECREECGGEIADLIGTVDGPLPDDTVIQLRWLALERADPPFGEADEVSEQKGDSDSDDALTRGINLTRGRAAIAIGHLIQRDAANIDRFRPTLEKLTEDKSEAVQTCVAYAWRVIATCDYQFALEMFLRSCLAVPSLPTSRYGYEILQIGLRKHFADLRPLVEKMLASSDPIFITPASQIACIAALIHPEAAEMASEVVVGNDQQRLAVAHVAAANIGLSEFRPWCEKHLLGFFDDPDSKVREAAGDCFRYLEGESLETFADLIESFCRSAAYDTNSRALLHTLEESVDLLPGIVCMACEHFLRRFGKEARDMRTHRALDGYRMPKLAFRIYHQHQRDKWASRSLNVIDQLCEEGIGETFNLLSAFDR
jgi:hypothetical protein